MIGGALCLAGGAIAFATWRDAPLYVTSKDGEREDVTGRKASYDELWSDATRATRDPGRVAEQKSRQKAWLAPKTGK